MGETYSEADRSADYEGRRTLEAVATQAPPNAVVIHHRSPLWYMNLVEGRRKDIRLVASLGIGLDDHETEAARAAFDAGTVAYILYPNEADVARMSEASLHLVTVEEHTLYEVVPREKGSGRESFG